MEKKLYSEILNKVKVKINSDRYERNLAPLTGEILYCIANRDIGIILDIVAAGDRQRKDILERIFMRYIPEVTEILIDKNRDSDAFENIKQKFYEEIEILEEFLFRIESGMDFKDTCKLMSVQIGNN